MANVSSESGAPAHPTATLKKTEGKKQQHTLAGEVESGFEKHKRASTERLQFAAKGEVARVRVSCSSGPARHAHTSQVTFGRLGEG